MKILKDNQKSFKINLSPVNIDNLQGINHTTRKN